VLADKLQSDFLRSINYSTDETSPRIILADFDDNATFQSIILSGSAPKFEGKEGSVSAQMANSYSILKAKLAEDIKHDPFKRLGQWSEFLTNRLYMAVFLHPDDATAYQVYEVVNTRGRDLTTADLLKNYILGQTAASAQQDVYDRWRKLAKRFTTGASNNFVQYIRHVVTVDSGYVLPRDLYSFIADRSSLPGKKPPSPIDLLNALERRADLYAQMIDPTVPGPASPYALGVFAALNALGVITVRPMLMAMFEADPQHSDTGMRYVLELVVRRIVVGNLGTGNVDRRFGEAARNVYEAKSWEVVAQDLKDLNPPADDFVRQLKRRSFNKGTLLFLRSSIINKSQTPESYGTLHYIWTPQWTDSLNAEQGSYWGSTIGNTYIAKLDRRPPSAGTWVGFKETVLPEGVDQEWCTDLQAIDAWTAETLEGIGDRLAAAGASLWY